MNKRRYRRNPNEILEALDNTPVDYQVKILQTRNPGPNSTGSVFLESQTWESLKTADWKPYAHPNIKEPAKAYKAPISGRLGIIRLDSLDSETPVRLADPKGNGNVEAEVAGILGDEVDFTVALVGPDSNGKPTIWTIFPGDPIMPSSIPAASFKGKIITAEEALDLGLEWAKIVAAIKNRNPMMVRSMRSECVCQDGTCDCRCQGDPELCYCRTNPDPNDLSDEEEFFDEDFEDDDESEDDSEDFEEDDESEGFEDDFEDFDEDEESEDEEISEYADEDDFEDEEDDSEYSDDDDFEMDLESEEDDD